MRQAVLPLRVEDQERWDRAMEIRRDRNALRHVAAQMKEGKAAGKKKAAHRVAVMIQKVIENSRADLADLAQEAAEAAAEKAQDPVAPFRPAASAPGVDEGTLDEFDQEIVNRERELLDKLGNAADRLCDTAYVTAVLQGNRRAVRGDELHLRFLVDDLTEKSKEWGGDIYHLVELQITKMQQAQLATAEAPQSLMLLQRYEQRLDGQIKRLLRELQRAR